MDTTAQWPQGIGLINKPMEAISSRGSSVGLERRGTSSSSSTRAHNKDQILNCPRCNSINTKFCYYNNYSLSQPRYFCKTCRRYWTQGGSLRNVPVGGGSRKHNKRSSSTTTSTSTSTSSPTTSSQALSKMIMINNGGQDLNLAYHPAAPTLHDHDYDHHQNYGSTTTRNNINMISNSSRGLISSLIMPPPVVLGSDLNTLYPTGLMFPLQDFKPTLNFSLDHHYQHQQQHHGYGSSNLQQDQVQGGTSSTSARLLFPVNDLLKEKVQSSSTDFNEHKNIGQEERDSSTTGRYNWNNNNNNNSNNGMLSGGSWR